MKRKAKTETGNLGLTPQGTAFELMMNLQCDLRDELGLEPLPHWKKTRQAPEWVENIYRKLRRTILKPISKLKPKRKFDWRNYGRCIGIIERHKIFLAKDVPRIFKAEGFDKFGKKS